MINYDIEQTIKAFFASNDFKNDQHQHSIILKKLQIIKLIISRNA